METETKWEADIANKLVDEQLVEYFKDEENINVPYMISITGIPGSGKTTSSEILKTHLQDLISSSGDLKDLNIQVLTLQMDGFHLYRSELDKLEENNPNSSSEEKVQAHYYRGAYWTFNSSTLLSKLTSLKDPKISQVSFPSFDHAVKDPEEDTVLISKVAKSSSDSENSSNSEGKNIPTIIITEGLYLLLKDPPSSTTYTGHIPSQELHLENFSKIASLFDYKIFINCDLETTMARVVERNTAAIGFDLEFWKKRVQEVDKDNAVLVIQNGTHADVQVEFQHDESRAE